VNGRSDTDGRPAAEVVEADGFVASSPASTRGTSFECGLCGTSFTHGERVCGACPLNAGCDLVQCPNCGYRFPRSSRLVDWARRLWRRAAGRGAA